MTSENVTDEGLRHLGGLDRLRSLQLIDTALTDAVLLDELSALRRLEDLHIYGAKITDAGIAGLANYPRLASLVLVDVDVTNASLATFRAVPALRTLRIRDTQVSREGLRVLESDMPNCTIGT